MRGRVKSISLFAFLAASVLVPSLQAIWIANGTAVSTASYDQGFPQVTSDGSGGAIITWEDWRSGSSADVYAQRIDAGGTVKWYGNGAVISMAADAQSYPQITSDGSGGAIITWQDYRSGTWDIYARWINASGNVQWTGNGVAISTAASTQSYPQITSDGSGGAIITWHDYRSGTSYDIYAQRINSSGTVQWTGNGVAISAGAYDQFEPEITTDGSGGAIITWRDYRSGTSWDVYAQRINSSGNVQWTSNGVAISTATNNQTYPQVTTDGSGGAIITWQDSRSGTSDIYAQRINASGTVQWTGNGVVISTAANNRESPQVTSDGSGGAIFTWQDYRSGNSDVYSQRIDSNGSIQWTSDGVAISTAASDQFGPQITGDGSGGAIITWNDSRSGTYDIYARRIDSNGNVQWTGNGVAISTAAGNQWFPQITGDGSGGAIIAWMDSRGEGGSWHDIYAQNIDAGGRPGYTPPFIDAVNDLPNDQGGWVRLEVLASWIDAEGQITGYNVWRRTTGIPISASFQTQSLSTEDLLSRISQPEASDGIIIGRSQAAAIGFPPGQWESLGFHAAVQKSVYAFVVPTRDDSTSSGTPLEVYCVSAHTMTPNIYYVSYPDSGYSVDNLRPAPPAALAGDQVVNPPGLTLHWNPNDEGDLWHYGIYRGTSETFVPGPGNLIAEPTDTTYFDSDWRWDSGYYYKVSAIDIHENESAFSLLRPADMTGLGGEGPIAANYLKQNYPNPFNPSTTIPFALKAPGRASLKIYDARGALVRVLVDGWRKAGPQSEVWDGRDARGHVAASGVYFARFEGDGFSESRKLILAK